MDQYNKASGRPQSPLEEDEDNDGEEHEHSRLVETPDPVIVASSRMENGGRSSLGAIYRDKMLTSSGKCQDFTSIQCQNEFYSNYLSSKADSDSSVTFKTIWKTKTNFSILQWVFTLVPILSWLPKYNWKSDLAFDIAAGFTVAVMHIPQGMAYAMLSNVEPIVGIYMAFFPVIMYSLVGTSRHISIGTFAVVCLMSGKVAAERASTYYAVDSGDNLLNDTPTSGFFLNETVITVRPSYSTEEIVTAISLCVGFWQILMGVFQLGSLSVLLSAELISGFTTGSAVHVLTSQMKNLFGLKIARRSGIFKIPLTYVDIVLGIKEANVTAVILSIVTISLLVIYIEFLKPLLNKRVPFPIPVELITIIIGTLLSRYWITSSTYGISVVNHIPTGLPSPALPPLEVVPDILVDSFIIAIVAYAISISMAKIFANKHQYDVRPNQELFANGSSNIFGSFFNCAPIAASLSRSLIQEQVGGKTQLAGLFSCTILLFVLLWIGPFFETLPHCILSSLIVVALKGMFMQVFDFPKAWKQSRVNGAIWMVSFLATVFLDIEYGLVIGVLLTVITLLWRSSKFDISEVGQHGQSHLFVEKKSDSNMVTEIPGSKVFKLTGNLNFATVDTFTSSMNACLMKAPLYLPQRTSKRLSSLSSHSVNFPSITTIILDFASVSSIDPAAVKCLRDMHDSQKALGVQVLYAACTPNVLGVMEHCKFLKHVNVQYFYPSVENAVLDHLDTFKMMKSYDNHETDNNLRNDRDYHTVKQ